VELAVEVALPAFEEGAQYPEVRCHGVKSLLSHHTGS
jgi:hypothetical protein